jgi:D-galactonate transporter
MNVTPPPPQRATPYSASEAKATYKKVFLRIIPFLIFCYLFNFLDRINVAFAKLQFTRELHFSEAVYGLGSGVFYIGYSLFEVPSNLMLDKIGIRKTLVRIMVLWGLFSCATAFMRLPSHYYVIRILLGAAEAGFFPGILFYVTKWVPLSRRAWITALFFMSVPFSGMVGGPLSGWVMQNLSGVHRLAGWQWLFLVEGMPACVLGVVAFFYLSDSPQQASWLTPREKGIILSDLEREAEADRRHTHRSIGAALRVPGFYVLAYLSFAVFTGIGGVTFWLPTIIRNSGVKGILNIGLLSSLPYAAGALTQILVARHSDRMLERRWHFAVPAMAASLGWMVMPWFAHSPVFSLLLLTLAALGILGAAPTFWSMPGTFLTGPARAAGIALISSIGAAASFASPSIVGWLAARTGSLAAGQYYLGAVILVSAFLVLAGFRDPRMKAARTGA